MTIGFTGALAVSVAAALDWLIGDPRWMLHPVQVMGWLIQRLRRLVEAWCRDSPLKLRLGGLLITLLLLGGSQHPIGAPAIRGKLSARAETQQQGTVEKS